MATKSKKPNSKRGSKLIIKAASESQIGKAFYSWWRMAYRGLGVSSPDLLFHIPNEGSGGNPIRGASLKAQGVVKGVPDYFLAIGSEYNSGFPGIKTFAYGLFIELKKKGGIESPQQKNLMRELTMRGYACKTCYGLDEAINAVKYYLGKS